jgi:SET domain-containing protein
MHDPRLEVRLTAGKGRGVFARQRLPRGDLILKSEGWLARTPELRDDWFALQLGADLWLCSAGDCLDDCINHSCDPNAGFVSGEPTLYALRDIEPGEEIGWDYSTSLSEPGWRLDCRCGAKQCRKVIRPWGELAPSDRERLRPAALRYLREMQR